jgi:tetratricopeptide (TPR) repeat protein
MPNDGAAPLNFADFLRSIGAGVESESFYQVAIAKLPWSVAARLKFGLLLEHNGKIRDAVQQLEEAASCYPRQCLLPETLAEVESQRGRIFAAHGRVSEAEPCLMQAARLAGRSETILTTVGIAWATLNEPSKARAALQRALTIDPDNVDARYNLGLLASAEGDLDGAIEHFDTLLAKRPDHELAALSLAQLAVRRNDYSRAAQTLDRAIKSRAGSPALFLERGIVSEHMGEYAPAIGFYEAAIGLRPDWAVATARLALLLAASPDAAARDGSRALKIVLATKPISSAEQFTVTDAEAVARAELGDYFAAEAAASRAIEIGRSKHRKDWERLETSRLRLYRQKRPLRIQHSAAP